MPLTMVLPDHVHKFIFSGLENIISVTGTTVIQSKANCLDNFIRQLSTILNNENELLSDSQAESIIQILKRVEPEMRATYTPYMMNFKFASEVIETLRKERVIVAGLLTAKEEELTREQERTASIESYLILPIQYKPRLLLLLSEIIRKSAH